MSGAGVRLLTKLHRTIGHFKEGVSRTRVRFLRPNSRSQSGKCQIVPTNMCCSYTTEANLMKLHRKIKHNKKVCNAQGLGS